MLKYVDAKVVFQEIPDEITLAINISNCPCHCKGCHSSYLAEDIGEVLDEDSLVNLMLSNKGVTCIAFMGGDSEPDYINWLASLIRGMYSGELDKGSWVDVKVAWYSGRAELSPCINLTNFDYIKLGPYIEESGPLNSKTTNQVMLHIDNSCGKPIVKDITSRFWK